MDNSEKREQLEQAIELINEARELVKGACPQSLKPNFEAYGEYGFAQLLGNGNRYDSSIYSIIDALENEEMDEDEDDKTENDFEDYMPDCSPSGERM